MKEWIIPAIVVAVWILNALLRNKENDEPVRKPRGKPNEDRPNRSPVSDIDRFLQEIERMKKKSAGEAPPAPKPARPPIPVARPVPVVRAATPRQKSRPGVSAPPPLAEPVRVVEPARGLRLAPAPPAPPVRRPFAGTLAMLRSPQSAAQAVILNEILGPPKSRRR